MRKLRVALIGCGRISGHHIKAMQEHDHYFEIAAVCDNIMQRAEATAELARARAYSSYGEMLEKESLDIVTICTPSGLHVEHGIMAAERGLHVITEKPMAINLQSADALIETCRRMDVKLFVVKQNRLNSTLQLVKKAIDQNRFGQIYMAATNVFWQRPQSYYEEASWRGTWALDGGAFMNQASHYVDMLKWLIGDVESVFAVTRTFARQIEAEDSGSAILRFKNGAIGNMNVTMLTYPKNLEGSLKILGETGTVTVGGTAVNRIDEWSFADNADEDALVAEANYTPSSVYGYGHSGYYKNVADSLLGGAFPFTDGDEGRGSLEIIEAIYRSAAQHREITLPIW